MGCNTIFDAIWEQIWRENGAKMEPKLIKNRIGIALKTDVCFKSDFQGFSETFPKDFQTSIREKYVKMMIEQLDDYYLAFLFFLD